MLAQLNSQLNAGGLDPVALSTRVHELESSNRDMAARLECAAYVDRTLAQVLGSGSLVEGHKAAILAALSITDELFQARQQLEELRRRVAGFSSALAAEVDSAMAPDSLASGL
jgi:cell division protein ZapA (FtsZ GTPase activity inhibitor)